MAYALLNREAPPFPGRITPAKKSASQNFLLDVWRKILEAKSTAEVKIQQVVTNHPKHSMQHHRLALSAMTAAALLNITPANAVSYSTGGSDLSVIGITGFQTDFDEIDGTLVEVTYSDGSVRSASFVDDGVGAGKAEDLGFFRLSGTGDTFTENWTLENLSDLRIDTIFINAAVGDSTFDRTLPNTGTAGSAEGRDWEFISSSDAGITDPIISIFYEDAVAVGAAPPVLDEWAKLTISFLQNPAGGQTALGGGQDLVFRQDMDTIGLFIPEPATVISGFVLAALGLFPVVRRLRRA